MSTATPNLLQVISFLKSMFVSIMFSLQIKIWEIPELGLHSNMTNWVVELRGHGRRVTYIEWHPTAENVLLSCAFDYRVRHVIRG